MKIKHHWLGLSLMLAACGGGGDGAATNDELLGLEVRPSNTTCLAQEPAPAGIRLVRKFPNLSFNQPVRFTQPASETTKWYLVERGGRVMSFINDQAVDTADVYIDISDRVHSGPLEAGLLGMAFHPDFAVNGEVFLSYTTTIDNTLVSRISRFQGDSNALDPASEEVLLALTQPFDNHNGGHISFGPDGFLYIGFGDGGSGSDPLDNAQNLQNLFGALLRIDVDQADALRDKPYAIPADNPFASNINCTDGGCPELYAWGLRNPWRWNFDRDSGAIWGGDVGQNTREEVNHIEAAKNYGWRCYEGSLPHVTDGCGPEDSYEFPVVEYGHDQGCSVTGGYVYRGDSIPQLQGKFIYGDFCSGNIWSVVADSLGNPAAEMIANATGVQIASFAEDSAGEIYVLDFAQGGIYQIESVANMPVAQPAIPPRLSATGCFRSNDPTVPVDALIPYDLNAPFWSDGAGKRRWMALPDNTQIRVDADGDWQFPVGTVLIKEFSLNGQRIETRFLEHRTAGWSGRTYQWLENETDAVLLETGKIEQVAGQNWSFPSPAQCLECHTAAAGRALGPETRQLQRPQLYPATGIEADQISTLLHIDLIENPEALQGDPIISPDDMDAPVELRAKAYLHANCSQCHRPGGTAGGNIDFRYQTPFLEMNICNVAPQAGDLGINDARLLVPADPARSVIAERIKRLDDSRMPPLGSLMIDGDAVALIDQWINSVTSCTN